jgi:hypothetical protein
MEIEELKKKIKRFPSKPGIYFLKIIREK